MQTPGLITEILPDALPNYSGVGIGAYQSVDHFSKLNTNISAPGLRTIFDTRPTPNVTRNKTTKLTNETIVTPVQPALWRRDYQTRQRPGEVIFVADPRQKYKHIDMETATPAQLNTILKDGYETVMKNAAKGAGRMLDEFERAINPPDAYIGPLVDRLKSEGEGIFDTLEMRQDTEFRMHYQYVRNISRLMILNKWRIFGSYNSDDGRGPEYDNANGQPVLSVAVGGVTREQEVYNYWGANQAGQQVGFILKRRLIKASSTQDKPVYGEFYAKPWCGRRGEAVPPPHKLRYYDDAGIVQFGAFWPAGRVAETPLKVSTKSERQIIAGITADEREAYHTEITTVVLIVGPSRHLLDVYQC